MSRPPAATIIGSTHAPSCLCRKPREVDFEQQPVQATAIWLRRKEHNHQRPPPPVDAASISILNGQSTRNGRMYSNLDMRSSGYERPVPKHRGFTGYFSGSLRWRGASFVDGLTCVSSGLPLVRPVLLDLQRPSPRVSLRNLHSIHATFSWLPTRDRQASIS